MNVSEAQLSWLEHLLDVQGVTGSSPVVSTKQKSHQVVAFLFLGMIQKVRARTCLAEGEHNREFAKRMMGRAHRALSSPPKKVTKWWLFYFINILKYSLSSSAVSFIPLSTHHFTVSTNVEEIWLIIQFFGSSELLQRSIVVC